MHALTVIILTKNEEQFIERCIRSVSWADEVLVLDSGSSDRTREIALSLGANVYQQEWLGYAAQRNKALSLAKNDWVFFVDSDEIVTPELARSLREALKGPMNERDGYAILNRRGDFYDLLLPDMSNARRRRNFVRMFNRQCSAYDATMIIHEEVRFPGKAIPLHGVLIHWRAFTMDEYIKTVNRNATAEARVLNEKGRRATGLRIFLWPVLRFGWNYVVKGSVRFGTRGLILAMLQATSEYIRYAKLWELQNATGSLHPPAQVYQGTHGSDSAASRTTSNADEKDLAQQSAGR
jgi:glycosyltransferase involved in cell wall biosynthesis